MPEIIPETESEFRVSQTRSSRQSRSLTIDTSIDAYTPEGRLTMTEFYDALIAKWEETKTLQQLDEYPPVDFDQVLNPPTTRHFDYILGLGYALSKVYSKMHGSRIDVPGKNVQENFTCGIIFFSLKKNVSRKKISEL